MKTKEITQEGVGQAWKNIKSVAKNIAVDFTGTPQQVARKNYINNFATNMLDALETAIEGGFVQPAPSVAESAKKLKTKYDRLNYILESLIQEAPTPVPIHQWVMEYLTRTTVGGGKVLDIFDDVPEAKEDFKEMANELESVYPKRSAVLKVMQKMGLKALIYMDKARTARSKKSEQPSDTSGTTGGSTNPTSPSATPTPTANPQEGYTQQLINQIGQMSKEYIDDMPRVVTALMNQIKKVDASVYNRILMQLGSKDAKFAYHDPMREGVNPNVKTRVKRDSLKKLDDAMGGVAASKQITRKY